LFVIRSRKTI